MSDLHVIFGTGPVGKSAMRELLRLGQRVRMINRSGNRSTVPQEVEVIGSDAYDEAANIRITQGATAIYQCAQPEYHQWEGNFPRLQSAIMNAAAANGAKFIVCDNLYMYGETNGEPISETSPVNPHTKKGKIRKAMAEAVMDAHKSGKVKVAVGRASNFFGPEDSITGNLIFYPALAGKSPNALGRLDMPHTFSYAPDFGKALATLGTAGDKALGQVWHIPNAPPVSQSQFLDALSKAIGKPVKPMVAGPFLMSVLGLFNPVMKETVEMMYEWQKPFVVDSRKFENAFSMRATPLAQAMSESVAWFRSHPKPEKH
ncbi:MAG: NAD-dependent epimerase/dehydratase family protein [Rhizobacter sp.]|nr:NAD-dependent epimerase/dehydratase family protein [Chlorobiales bacterium]